MITGWSNRAAAYLVSLEEKETPSVPQDQLAYSISILIHFILMLAGTVMLGFFLGHPGQALLFMFGFCLLRLFSGGFHASSLEACLLISCLLFVTLPLVLLLHIPYIRYLDLVSLLLILRYAPRSTEQNLITPKLRHIYKYTSCMIVASNFLWFQQEVFTLAFISQALTIMHWGRFIRMKKAIVIRTMSILAGMASLFSLTFKVGIGKIDTPASMKKKD
ncbi:hypothetical protein SY83_04605 [Paenibacillus swuensis]|uniref:Accessory gene regulator B n=1 Tax=Paenibacillus swuensis TaxID=1178515 RepID=A0A172TF67_9BACL|nr:accessory gene regulator B family protein [Paenibacillus swuensis]ANE45699.1 hypothetical protein SY83_04605 [Paenibacillus swuensis]